MVVWSFFAIIKSEIVYCIRNVREYRFGFNMSTDLILHIHIILYFNFKAAYRYFVIDDYLMNNKLDYIWHIIAVQFFTSLPAFFLSMIKY